MAPKKKADMPDDVQKMKDTLAKRARAVRDAAGKTLSVPVSDTHLGQDWDAMVKDVDDTDDMFGEEEVLQKENFVDFLRSKLRAGNTEVRVMQVQPDGKLVDVSDKIKAEDLKAEKFSALRTEDGKMLTIGRTPQSREEAYQILREALPELLNRRLTQGSSTSESIRKMELVLAESDKILQHWKK